MTKGEFFFKNANCKHGHPSAMSNSVWCDLNKSCTVLKSLDLCNDPKFSYQKQIAFTPKPFQLEGGSIKSKLQKYFKCAQTTWKNFLKPAVNVAAPFIGKSVIAKTKNPKVGVATTNILKSISGGVILGLTDMHGNGLRSKVR